MGNPVRRRRHDVTSYRRGGSALYLQQPSCGRHNTTYIYCYFGACNLVRALVGDLGVDLT